MNKLALLLVAVSVDASAVEMEDMRSRARNDSVDTLCMVQILRPELAQIARDELLLRKAKCDWDRTKLQTDVYMQQQQQRSLAIQQKASAEKQEAAAVQQADQLEGLRASAEFDRRQRENEQIELAKRQEKQARENETAQIMQNAAILRQLSGPHTLGPMPATRQSTTCRTVYYPGGARTVCD